MHKLGVMGAGQMGLGIAQTAAQSGFEVWLGDIGLEQATQARQRLGAQLQKLVEKGKMPASERDQILERIHPVGAIAEMADCDLAVEAVSEKFELKASIFREFDSRLKPEAILASNTSSISITRIAQSWARRASAM